jgi:hypothetical protein
VDLCRDKVVIAREMTFPSYSAPVSSCIAPKCKISIPLVELMGFLVAFRLYQKIRDSLKLDIGEVRIFINSSAVLGMIFRDSESFLEFVGTRVSEIRTK